MESRDVDELLMRLRRDRWTFHAFPDRRRPEVLAYTRNHGKYWDVVLLRGRDRAAAYRVATPRQSVGVVLAPKTVVWAWLGDATETLRRMFALPAPDDPLAPKWPQPAPGECGITADERQRWSMRPPEER